MRKSLNFIRLTAALTAAVLIVAPGAVLAQKRGGTLVQITEPEPPTLASYLSTAGPIGQVTAKIYDGLLEYDFNMRPQPSLAESWIVAPDGKSITFKLRKGVKFHDGTPFTSADVQFTIMNVLKKIHPRGINTFKEVAAVETPDPHTAIFKLSEVAPYIMSALSGYESPMLPKHIFSAGDIRSHAAANKPVGTGPFKFIEWRRGELIRLHRNEDYWRRGQPYLDRVVVRFVPDSATRTALLEAGEAHVAGVGAIPYNDVKRLAALPTIEVTTKGYEMISPVVEFTLNTKRPPFDNLKVRQAVSYAVDRRFAIENIFFGFVKLATGPISSNFKPVGFYSPDVRNYDVPDRIDRANKLLDEAGFRRKTDGTRFEIVLEVLPYGEDWRRWAEAVQQQLSAVGIKATLRHEDVAGYFKRLYTDYDFDVAQFYIYNLSDPVLGVHREFHSRMIQKGTVAVNNSRWSSPRTDELMNKATIEPDASKRGAYYAEFQKLVVEASPSLWVFELRFPTVLNKKAKNVIVSPLGIYADYHGAWLDR